MTKDCILSPAPASIESKDKKKKIIILVLRPMSYNYINVGTTKMPKQTLECLVFFLC